MTKRNSVWETLVKHFAFAAGGNIWDAELNKMAHYRDLIKHPNKAICEMWTESGENEFGRLFNGYGDVKGLNVLEWIEWEEVPRHKKVTYAQYTVAYRPEKEEQYRSRITAGGDQLDYDGDVSTSVSTMEHSRSSSTVQSSQRS